MSFDPYHQWLGIPPEEQPPDLYQLLGIRRFETNPTVISHAAERQLLMLKTMQNGPHGALTQKLMNEITAAHIRLLDPQKKSQYDVALHRQLDRHATAQPPRPLSPKESVATGPPPATSPKGPQAAPAIQQPPHHKQRSKNSIGAHRRTMWLIAATVTAVGFAFVVLLCMPDGIAQRRNANAGRNQENSRQSNRIPVAQSNAKRGADPTEVPSSQRERSPRNSGADPAIATSPTQSALAPGMASGMPPATSNLPAPGVNRATVDDPAAMVSSSEPRSKPAVAATAAGATGSSTDATPHPAGVGDDAPPLSQLPSQLNLRDTIAATGTNYVFVGKLASPAESSWRVAVDDYASPIGRSRFVVGAATDAQGQFRWPLYRSGPDESSSNEPTPTSSAHGAEILARIEASATELALWISDPEDHQLISELSMCSLLIDAGSSKHHIQLAVHRSIPPVLLAFDRARQTITLDELPCVEELPPERLLLEIVQVDQSATGVWEGSGLRTPYDEEFSVPINSDLQCELGIKLTKNDQQYGISVMPRFAQNDRRQPMVPNTITKELARAKSQLTRNQRDLVEAQNSLRVLPQEISRVRAAVPRTPAEAAAKQAQLSRLVGMVDSMQSRVRRLSKVIPDQIATIERMERVLAYAESLSDRITLLVRVYARGELQDYLLLDTGTDSAVNSTGS